MLAIAAFVLASSTFHANAAMPRSTVGARCGGGNVSPALQWSGAPRGTRSFALVVHDPDAPVSGGFYHWVIFDIPPSAHGIAAGSVPQGARQGLNSAGDAAYTGPCPPPGKPHHYHFTLYALDIPHLTGDYPTGPGVEAAIAHHVLARAEYTGLYGR